MRDFYELQKLIGMNLKRLRIELGLTQVEFADKYEISIQIISRLEGENVKDKSISLEMIFYIAQMTFTDMRDLFNDYDKVFLNKETTADVEYASGTPEKESKDLEENLVIQS